MKYSLILLLLISINLFSKDLTITRAPSIGEQFIPNMQDPMSMVKDMIQISRGGNQETNQAPNNVDAISNSSESTTNNTPPNNTPPNSVWNNPLPTQQPIAPPIEEDPVIILNKDDTTDNKASDNAAELAATLDDPEDIVDIRMRVDEVKHNLNKPLYNTTSTTREVNYSEGKPISIVIKKGFSTIIQFEDSSANKVKFEYISPGSPFIQVTQFNNKIEIKAKDHYKHTNLTVGIKGYKKPVIFNITEDARFDSFVSFLTVNMSNQYNFKSSGDGNIEVKSQILNEVFKFNELKKSDLVDYEVYGLRNRDYVLFNESLLKIYRINRHNKDYYLVLLNKNFEMYGYNKQSFSQYNNSYNVYFLNYNDSVFTIRTSKNSSINESYLEKYRIVIKG